MLWRMTDYNWSEINGEVTDRLVRAKTPAVPAAIIALAQKSVDTDPTLAHCKAGHWQFGEDETERCENFVKLMRKAGYHTKPESLIKVVADPLGEGNILYIEWYARLKPGRKTKDNAPAAPAAGAPVPAAA